MMKLKARKDKMCVGSMELDNVLFNEDCLEICIDILDMSEKLKAEINKAIEIEKVRFSEEWEEHFTKHGCMRFSTEWSDKPVIIEGSSLFIELEAGKPIKYTIDTAFHDSVNDRLNPTSSIDIDLSDYAEELKKTIIHALIDRFF